MLNWVGFQTERLAMNALCSDLIYEALFDEEVLFQMPDLIAKAANARSAMVAWTYPDLQVQEIFWSYFPRAMLEQYCSVWVHHDPYIPAGMKPHRMNRIFLANEDVPVARLVHQPFFEDFTVKAGDDTLHCMGGVFTSPLVTGHLGIQRGRRAEPFTETELEMLRPHARDIGRLLKIRGQLMSADQQVRDVSSALDALSLAAARVSRDGRVITANTSAELVFRREDGFVVKQGRLVVRDSASARALGHAVSMATASEASRASWVTVERGAERSPYYLSVAPVRGGGAGRSALILFKDPDSQDRQIVDRLRRRFGFTQAEAGVATDLASGLCIADISVVRGVSLHTVRTQLKSAMAKSGTHKQSQLVALVARATSGAGLPRRGMPSIPCLGEASPRD